MFKQRTMKRPFKRLPVFPVTRWRAYDDLEDSGQWVTVFPRGIDRQQAEAYMIREGVSMEGHECGHYHDCCGCRFSSALRWGRDKWGRIWAKQSQGRNV